MIYAAPSAAEQEELLLKPGQTVLILPNVSPNVVERSYLQQPYNQLAVIVAIAVTKNVNVVLPRHFNSDDWNTGNSTDHATDIDDLVQNCHHVWCVGFWTRGTRLDILKEAVRQNKPITFLNWDALNAGFMIEDKDSFKDNEKAMEEFQNDTAFAYRYLDENDPYMEEIILGIPPDKAETPGVLEPARKDQDETDKVPDGEPEVR